ncbi:phytanoyl-CoA dioxygenase [Paracoccus sp. S-4012]|uniref:phytanoyl-CoA dioxygenase n=1 Tax=Paracoccus sp. S-4012 TaxID=2665648 RepID=UPI0012AF340A|nr:phytanoyl-CoA dioxygenase [Paracoccus sp. S-4012]MRX52051.1 phytanoyl-CoA dioxygenase [Paracoccus sp. S-4012]
MAASKEVAVEPAGPVVSDLRTNGYAIFPNVLTSSQIDQLRGIVASHLGGYGRPRYGGRFQLRSMNRDPALARLLSCSAIAEVMKSCTSPDDPVLTGECDIMADTTSSWHKDITSDMGLDGAIYRDATFQVFKLAIYLQDQPAGSRSALKVRPGTHLRTDGEEMPATALPIRRGDVAVFDVRINHAGQLPTLGERLAHRLAVWFARALGGDPEVTYTRLRENYRALMAKRQSRLAVFMTFGPNGPALQAYEKAGRHRHGPLPADIDAAAVADFAAQGVRIVQAT